MQDIREIRHTKRTDLQLHSQLCDWWEKRAFASIVRAMAPAPALQTLNDEW